MNKKILICLLIFILPYVSFSQVKRESTFRYTAQKKVKCRNGAVVSAHPLASRLGMTILEKGGNAFDAAIATQFALAVVYPGAGNIGGGGFMVAHVKDGKNIALDYRERAPSLASRDMYLDSTGKPQMHLSQEGHLAAGVPGSIAGIFAEFKYASLPFKKLIQPAIDLAAKEGCAISITGVDAMRPMGAKSARGS